MRGWIKNFVELTKVEWNCFITIVLFCAAREPKKKNKSLPVFQSDGKRIIHTKKICMSISSQNFTPNTTVFQCYYSQVYSSFSHVLLQPFLCHSISTHWNCKAFEKRERMRIIRENFERISERRKIVIKSSRETFNSWMKVVAVHAFFSVRRELKQKKERKKKKMKMKTQTSQNISCYNIFSCRVAVEARATERFTVNTEYKKIFNGFLNSFCGWSLSAG